MATERVLDVLMRRYVFETDQPFAAVFDDISSGVRPPISPSCSANSRRAARTRSSVPWSSRREAAPA